MNEQTTKVLRGIAEDIYKRLRPAYVAGDFAAANELRAEHNALLTVVHHHEKTRENLDTFTRAYILCAFWTQDEDAPGGCDYRDTGRFEELFPMLSAEALEQMIVDCANFRAEYGAHLAAFEMTDEQNGHDFWLTRNHHGTGFWDRSYGRDPKFESIGDKLTEAAHKFGECDLYVGDDGLYYL